ncbi:GNAT family N-acetyltransferase [Nocardia sp. NPDC052566]|uniref:GNAT family N-acetyltransferase n=1 Tax=Nocardia sp. NPDC052566 TaxID=3364330 RepID=UPI0037C7D0C5
MRTRRPSLATVRLGPVELAGRSVLLRPPELADFAAWRQIRLRDRAYIEPYWYSSPLDWAARHTGKLWVRECSMIRADARAGRRLSLAIEVDGAFAGQIELGSLDKPVGSAEMGIWVDARVARHGIGALAVAMLLDYGFGSAGLRRITAPISPENIGATRGAEVVGFRHEALMARYFDSGGARRDHDLWAVIRADVPPEGFTPKWLEHCAVVSKPVAAQPVTADAGVAVDQRGAPRALDPAEGAKSATDAEPSVAVLAPEAPARALPDELPARAHTLSPLTVLTARARYRAGRARHALDPLLPTAPIRLVDHGPPMVVVRDRTRADRTAWRAAKLHHRELTPDADRNAAKRRYGRRRWLRESLCARAGLRSPSGLVLAIEVDGAFRGECRLFDLDMFDHNAELHAWTDAETDDLVRMTALRLLLDHAFTRLGLQRVSMAVAVDDAATSGVAARLGMTREGTMRDHVGPTGRRADHELWAITLESNQRSRPSVDP